MLSDKSRSKWWQKKEKNHSIEHKIVTTLIVFLLIFLLCTAVIYVLLSSWSENIGIVLSVIISIILAVFLAKKTAYFLNYKFVDQVNKMTGTAKTIANSRDLSKRIEASGRPDELSHLEDALNSMLEQLEESFEMQKRFTADASHEIRTPIAVLTGYLDILKEWGKNDPALLEESVDAMKEETKNLKKLSENLLLLSRLELNEHDVKKETVELSQIVNKLVKDTELIAGGRKVQCLSKSSVILKGDYSLLLQMLRAVIENSIKYTEENGLITISQFVEHNQAIIEVSDNGIGIPKNELDKIFERFYRVDKGRDRRKGGTGLGLSLVKHIAELHDGMVEVESCVGQGTTIRFYLPIVKG